MALRLKTAVSPANVVATSPALQRDRLRLALPATVASLKLRHADRIDADDIDAYVALNWLEWQGGGLRLTITGQNVCAQQQTQPAAVS